MTPETAYNEATLKNLADPNGTRMDVIYTAMHIFRNELIDEEIGFLRYLFHTFRTFQSEQECRPESNTLKS